MRECMNQVKNLLEAKVDFIWIDTYEEAEVIRDFASMVNTDFFGTKLHVWSMTEGLKRIPLTKYESTQSDAFKPIGALKDPHKMIEHLTEIQMSKDNVSDNENFFILRDFHIPLEHIQTLKRSIRDAKEYPYRNYNPIIVVAPIVHVPIELEKIIHVVNYDTMSKAEIGTFINNMKDKMMKSNEEKGKSYTIPTDKEISSIINSLAGLTFKEIRDITAISLIEHNSLKTDSIMNAKMQLIRRSGVLNYKIPEAKMEDIGGNEAFKKWVKDVELAMSKEAQEFGCAHPKGYLSLGIPGAAKTVTAEAIANKMGVPFIIFEMSKIMDKLVGNSEKKIEQALRIVKACAPCVLLIDEIEKALGGIQSSNSSDSGTTARVFQSILTFLHNNKEVFVVMTSNDVSQLPPELTRSGRLDAMWYFQVPSKDEREIIFRIHLDKTGKEYDKEILQEAARRTPNYTGAEIENIVKSSVWKAYRRYTKDNDNRIKLEDVLESIPEIIPVYESSKEKIAFLEHWARGRARYANEVLDENGFDMTIDDNLRMSLEV